LFLAADLSAETRRALVAKLEGWRDRMPGRVVPPPNWHLTLRFLGDVAELDFDKLVYGMSNTDLGTSFSITFGKLGAFPRPERATVLWLGVKRGEEQLNQLARRVEEAVDNAGFPAEDRPFRAHLTLSRIRPTDNISQMLAQAIEVDVKGRIDAVTLFRSHLGKGGATYEQLEHFPLQGVRPRTKG
jgi:2'-5' RNA ligase